MPVLEAESPSTHLMGLTHGFSLSPDWEYNTLVQTGRNKINISWGIIPKINPGNEYLNGTLAFPVGAEKQEGIFLG